VTANAPAYAAACDGTATAELQARFETDAIPHMRQMFPAAYRLTQDRCDAEDLIQETFARAYVKFHQFEPGTNVRAWLYCIMFRTFCSTRRKRGRQPAEVLADDLSRSPGGQAADSQAGLVPPTRSAEAEALDGLGDSAVMRALAELPTQFKTALYLADIQGYEQSDIADIMGTPVGTVMSRIHRGRAMLRAKLRPEATAPVRADQRAPVQRAPVQPAPVQPAPVQPARFQGAREAVPFESVPASSAPPGNLPLAA
jgi:RNA polymerase sigma-70 factor, ECF subfamily